MDPNLLPIPGTSRECVNEIFQEEIFYQEEVAFVDEENDSLLQEEAVIDNAQTDDHTYALETEKTYSSRITQPVTMRTYKTYERHFGTTYRWHKSGRPKKIPKDGRTFTYIYSYKLH
ncbi:uncharacterized protein LOC127287513 [Leptopilina boulardi]|uniref:uncharacterized protein LOC127286853 n=1 Tax=Leptopilina boulardi TaxID=63433 RepID=UPI0021F5398C|nr:uncharacterized protein LOC127286853 [Leptopilina boulardi]XP_051170458.1 uncharacterized protein LOC127287513 [Leptopilina boulardi]